ncbi:flagellar export protein FliJ [Magnetospirillum sp. UT-4]|uniref:flagellar export protein FliJ n=1 Tax=Magnetospirillum sp. UT-4 TaxID=2681467 RepID=UPI0013830D54|nr:flagellar export protein FliJ [Magnetospirillum sp. UT-4]CAA7621612.1 conserved hypothetical protein [Magnetospirillum sp. UT-4]
MAGSKGIKTLIRLSKFAVDEKRRALTALQAREDEILGEIAHQQDQLVEEQRIAGADSTGVGFIYGAYQRAWMNHRDDCERSLALVRGQIEAARDELAGAYRELKTYEITQANREKREREEADRKDQIFLDEVGLTQFRRKDMTAND